MNNEDIEQFVDIKTPEIAYLLGLLWADGSLCKRNYSTRLELITTDFNSILPIFDVFKKTSIYCRKRKNRKPISSIVFNSIKLGTTLDLLDFHLKKDIAPYKMLKKIPSCLHHYWWRGYFDGDGCFYDRKTTIRHSRQVYFTSSYEQDWGEHGNLLETLHIKYSTVKRITNQTKKDGSFCKYSQLRFTNKDHIKIFGDYIYRGVPFGFKRKRDKFNDMF